jgi:circadian clock protein KaiC
LHVPAELATGTSPDAPRPCCSLRNAPHRGDDHPGPAIRDSACADRPTGAINVTRPKAHASASPVRTQLTKAPTGINGLDEITLGGLPSGRTTLICGSAGCGKTLLAMEFIIRGATQFNEPGVFVAFEETAAELTENVASLGFNLEGLIADHQIVVDAVVIERSDTEETGEYDLEGLFIRLGQAIASIGAKRVVLDSIEALFAGLPNLVVLRAELHRLFHWLKDQGVTSIVTGERGAGTLTRQGMEEYVSDCVIVLDQQATNQGSSRLLRIIKYRGSLHGTNVYPFLIDEDGISVLPITSLGLQHLASAERISSGVARLDTMLGGKGYYRGSSVLVTGMAGTGKSSLAATFVDATCRRGERALYFSFEESADQLIRNTRSIGIDLEPWVAKGLLLIHPARPTLSSLELHLITMRKAIGAFEPRAVVIDPLNSFVGDHNETEVKALLLRLVDFLKTGQITAFMTSLTAGGHSSEQTEVDISSMIDTWLLLRAIEANGERNRGMYILKSRGMNHSNQIREFVLSDHGVELRDVYVGASGVLAGSARIAQEAQEQAAQLAGQQDIELRQLGLERKRKALEVQIASLRGEFEAHETEALRAIGQAQTQTAKLAQGRVAMGMSRKVDATVNKPRRGLK